MHAHINRAGVRAARLGLESLEGRIVLSTTVPAPAPVVGHTATTELPVLHLTSVPTVQATYAHFGYHWGTGKAGTVILGTNSTTGNGKSTGSVDFALVRDGSEAARVGGPAVYVPIGFVMTTSSASPSHPDQFHTGFSLTLQLRDAASGAIGTLTFSGTINGTMTWSGANLTATFSSPTTQKLTLGKHVYTVTLPHTIRPTGPLNAPATLYAQVQVTPRT
jgi:hypothetical protein